MGFLPILSTEAWENTEILRTPRQRHLLIPVYGYYDAFFQTERKKVIDNYPKLLTAALRQPPQEDHHTYFVSNGPLLTIAGAVFCLILLF